MKVLATILWLAAAVVGLQILANHANRPGAAGAIPSAWPRDAAIEFTARQSNLVLALHPQCPCSRATVDSLSAVLAHTTAPLTIHVLVYKPAGESAEWMQTGLIESVRALPYTRLIEDIEGREADKFGAVTSGAVQLYAADGRLLFNGGITPSRGHGGDSVGKSRLVALLNGKESRTAAAPVFGCGLAANTASRNGQDK